MNLFTCETPTYPVVQLNYVKKITCIVVVTHVLTFLWRRGKYQGRLGLDIVYSCFDIFAAILNHVLTVAWYVRCKCYVTAWERVLITSFENVGDALQICDAIKLGMYLSLLLRNPVVICTQKYKFPWKKNLIRRYNSWLDSASKAAQESSEKKFRWLLVLYLLQVLETSFEWRQVLYSVYTGAGTAASSSSLFCWNRSQPMIWTGEILLWISGRTCILIYVISIHLDINTEKTVFHMKKKT